MGFRCVLALCTLALLTSSGCKRKNRGPAFEAVKIAVGESHACAVMKDASVMCWGADGEGSHRLAVRTIPAGANIAAIAAGHGTTCTTSSTGALGCVGADARVPMEVGDGVAEVALGKSFTCARRASGKVPCWTIRTPPADVPALPTPAEIVAGDEHACARLLDGSVRCWGRNDQGQLGDGTTHPRATLTTPAPVKGIAGVLSLAAGGAHTCAVTPERTAVCWGKNDHGQLGDGSQMRRTEPVAVVDLVAVRGVSVGESHSCARVDDGTARCWGQNDVGELANGSQEDRALPIMIPGLFKVTDVRLGSRTTCALTEDSRIWCWGKNDRGQSGDGSEADRPVPVAVRFEAP